MAIFSRLLSRLGAGNSSRVKAKPRNALLRIEPLEERRLLDVYDLVVSNVPGIGREDEVKLTWNDIDTNGYEIQSSISGFDGAGGLWQTINNIPASLIDASGKENITITRFRSSYGSSEKI